MARPPAFDPRESHGEVYGSRKWAYAQNGWYYDGFHRPVEEIEKPEPLPPEHVAVMKLRKEMNAPPPPKLVGVSIADDDELGIEIRRRRLEDRLARAAEESAE